MNAEFVHPKIAYPLSIVINSESSLLILPLFIAITKLYVAVILPVVHFVPLCLAFQILLKFPYVLLFQVFFRVPSGHLALQPLCQKFHLCTQQGVH